MKKWPLTWFTKLKTEPERAEFRARMEECRDVLDRLREMCESKQEESLKRLRDKKSHDKPDWACYLAHELGYQSALEELINLLGNNND